MSQPAERWLGPWRLVWRTRRARRRQDAGAALRAVARGADTAVGLRRGGQRILLLLDPGLAGQLLAGRAADTVKGPGVQLTRAMLGNGLLTSEGAQHDQARRLVAPAFSPRRLDHYVTIFGQCAHAHVAGWQDGQQVDAYAEMGTLTLQIVGRSLLGIDLTAQAPRVRAGLESALAEFGRQQAALPGLARRFRPAKPAQAARRGQPPGQRQGQGQGQGQAAAQAALHRLIDEISEQRRATPDGGDAAPDRGDVMSALLAASAEPGGLTPADVHDHVITLLMAGHETTASALAWTLHLLGRHHDAQDRVQAEVDALDGPPCAKDLPALRYTRAVVSEAIRLYPPAWIIGRTVTADLELGGWHLPTGSVAAVSPLLLHHDPRWFSDPEAFDPGRWLSDRGRGDRRNAISKGAYLPFGTGPRACIGEQFAWAEAVTVLAVLARSWAVRTDPGFRPAIEYRVTLRPAGGLPVVLRSRH